MWWSGQYNRAIPLDMTVELTKGSHTMTIYGAEGCCDGSSEIRFKAPGTDDWQILSRANLEQYKGQQATRTFEEDTLYEVEVRVVGNKIEVTVDSESVATYDLDKFDAYNSYEPAFPGPGECLTSSGDNAGEVKVGTSGLSVEECTAYCDADDTCVAVDYDDSNGNCWTNTACDTQDTDHYSTWKKKDTTSNLGGSGYGGFGFQTWKADMHAVNVEFLRSWASDPALTECFPMEPQPTTPEDTDEFPLTAEIAQNICDEFSSVGCGGFLFITRMAQEYRTNEAKASVTYCTRDTLTFNAEPTESDAIGYYRDGSM